MTVHLLTDSEDLLDPVGLVDQVGLVLLAGVQVMVRPAAVGLVGLVVMAVTEDISSERVREVSTTETQSGHGTRFDANCTPPGEVHVGGMIAISPFLSVSSCFVCLCLSYGPRKYSLAIVGCETIDKASIHSCCLFLIFFFPPSPSIPVLGRSRRISRSGLLSTSTMGQHEIKPSTDGRSGKGRGCV